MLPELQRTAERDPNLRRKASEITRDALAKVIHGNFTGTGPYAPRPVGTFKGQQSRTWRAWVNRTYGSSRARRAGARSQEEVSQSDGARALAERQRDRFLLQGALDTNPEKYGRVREQALAARKAAQGQDATAILRTRLSQGVLGAYARSKKARKMLHKRRGSLQSLSAGKMRFGVQTGRLARAWYDLSVKSTRKGDGFTLSATPDAGTTTNTPDAETLTGILSRRPGWNGLLSTQQLVTALRDEGVIAVD